MKLEPEYRYVGRFATCKDCRQEMIYPIHRVNDEPTVKDNVCLNCYQKRITHIKAQAAAHRSAWWEKAYYQ